MTTREALRQLDAQRQLPALCVNRFQNPEPLRYRDLDNLAIFALGPDFDTLYQRVNTWAIRQDGLNVLIYSDAVVRIATPDEIDSYIGDLEKLCGWSA